MYTCYVNLVNPYIYDADGKGWHELAGKSTDDISSAAQQQGYDGVIFKNVADLGSMVNPADIEEYKKGHTHYVVFDPQNIKIVQKDTIVT